MPIAFRNLPLIVRIATLVTLFDTWVLIEELMIDRQGLDRFLPFYRFGELCAWDLSAAALLLMLWWRLHKV